MSTHKEHKESKGFFRRIRSPLEHKNTAKHHDDKHHRSSSTSVTPPVQHSNGHKRSGSDDVLRIENSAYGDPEVLNNITPRSQSTGSSPGDALNPPLPPRNPPKQPSSMGDESPLYVAPADTLQRGNSGGGISPAVLSNYTRTEPITGPPSRSERKVMEMHQLTMSQKQAQSSSQPTQRVQTVIDDGNSEYSTPFNVLQQQRARQGRSSIGSERSSGRQRRVPQVGMSEEGDQIIPVLSPPPDRSQTTSPSSPLSTPSSEHEEGGVGPSSGGGGGGTGGDSDYDIPWDKKFKNFPNFNQAAHPRRQTSGGKMHSLPEEHSPMRGRKQSPPQRNMYNQGHPERNSPPAPPERYPPIGGPGGPVSYPMRRTSSPQPPLEDGLFGRPRHLPSRHHSEQHRPRDGSTSPSQLPGRSYGHTIHGPHVPRELPPEISPRTSSMSMSGRRLPSPPRERSESSPVDPNRWGMLRPPSPPNPVHIDFSIPLCDQP